MLLQEVLQGVQPSLLALAGLALDQLLEIHAFYQIEDVAYQLLYVDLLKPFRVVVEANDKLSTQSEHE